MCLCSRSSTADCYVSAAGVLKPFHKVRVCVCVFSHSCVHSCGEGEVRIFLSAVFLFLRFSFLAISSPFSITLLNISPLSLSHTLFYPPSVSRSPNLFPRLISNSLLIPDLILSPRFPFFAKPPSISSLYLLTARRCLLLVNYIFASTQTGNS